MRVDTTFINEQNYNWEDKAVLANTFKVLNYKRALQGIELDRRNYMPEQLNLEKKKREELFKKYENWFDYYDEY